MADLEPSPRVTERPATFTVAALLLLLKAGLGTWAAIALYTGGSFLGRDVNERPAVGGIILAFVLASLLVAWGLLSGRPWARGAAIALEVIALVFAALYVGDRPAGAIASIALSVIVIALLTVTRSRRAQPGEVGPANASFDPDSAPER